MPPKWPIDFDGLLMQEACTVTSTEKFEESKLLAEIVNNLIPAVREFEA
jgi:hypothetical protein